MSSIGKMSSGLTQCLDAKREIGDPLADETIGVVAGVREKSADPAQAMANAARRRERLLAASGLLRRMTASATDEPKVASREIGGEPAHRPLKEFLQSG